LIIVIGAGPTGLSAAMQLESRGCDWMLLEAGSASGGLSRSFTDDQGFTWDLGGHIEFSRFEPFDRCFEASLADVGWLEHTRSSHVILPDGRWAPFPVQYNLHRLAPDQRQACVEGMIAAAAAPKARLQSYENWVDQTLGVPFRDLFLGPYTRKIWGRRLADLDFVWVDDKVAAPRLDDVLTSIRLDEDYTTWGPTHRFRYPRVGGVGAIWAGVTRSLPASRLRFGQTVSEIDAGNRIVRTADGQAYVYDELISTVPLDRIVHIVSDPTMEEHRIAAHQLDKSSVHVIGLGFRGETPASLSGLSWLYNADPDTSWFRLTVLSNLSAANAPEDAPHWSVLLEIAETQERVWDETAAVETVLGELRAGELIAADAVPVSRFYQRLHHGYPVPVLGRDEIVDPILRALEALNIYSRGRFGVWRYEVSNQDHAFMQGLEVVGRILDGTPETVIDTPHRLYRRA
jgi:protoporphyrinogen oxidase